MRPWWPQPVRPQQARSVSTPHAREGAFSVLLEAPLPPPWRLVAGIKPARLMARGAFPVTQKRPRSGEGGLYAKCAGLSRDYSCMNDRTSSGVTLPSLFTSTLSKIRL
jgi:hypothetical protein